MDGIHDMGGMDGFGKVEPEDDEPVFHATWEGRVLAINRAMAFAGAWNIDMSRFARERLAPAIYLTSSYYKRWALAMEASVIERNIVTPDELKAGRSLHLTEPPARMLSSASIESAFRRGSFERTAHSLPKFRQGDHVRAKNIHPGSHTRLPRYARGHVGIVDLIHGCHVFPDSAVCGLEEDPQWLYTVSFDGAELWGENSDPTLVVSVDAFEPYLEPA